MTLDDALSCGEIIKVVVKDGYYVYNESNVNEDVHYGLTVNIKNLNGAHRSDVGVRLRNNKREQEWTIETEENTTGDVGIALKWTGALLEHNTGLKIYQRESSKGYKAIFDDKSRIEQGRLLEAVDVADKINIQDLGQQEADELVLYTEAKKFEDTKLPGEVVAGIMHNGVDSLLTNGANDGISANSLIAALVKSVQGLTALVKALYAKRVGEREYIVESCIPIVLLIGSEVVESHGTEHVNYTINHYKFLEETGQTIETIDDIQTVGTAQSLVENAEGADADNADVQ